MKIGELQNGVAVKLAWNSSDSDFDILQHSRSCSAQPLQTPDAIPLLVFAVSLNLTKRTRPAKRMRKRMRRAAIAMNTRAEGTPMVCRITLKVAGNEFSPFEFPTTGRCEMRGTIERSY